MAVLNISDPLLLQQVQNEILLRKLRALNAAPPKIDANIRPDVVPSDSTPFRFTSVPAVAYPAPGAAAVTVLSLTVDPGLNAVLNYLAIMHIGGGFVDFSGNVVWRVFVNGGAVKGLHNITSQVGTLSQPNPFFIPLVENDVLSVTAEVPAAQPAMPAGAVTAALFAGWFYPIQKAGA